MICICCILGQIFSNLFKVDATMVQIATYGSFVTTNEISSFWFTKNIQIPFKLIFFTFFSMYNFFETQVCQIFAILMGVG